MVNRSIICFQNNNRKDKVNNSTLASNASAPGRFPSIQITANACLTFILHLLLARVLKLVSL